MSRFSSNIRNNGGFLNRCDPEHRFDDDKLFYQQGRKVFKDVVPLASRYIADHLASLGLEPDRVRRYWLHQANRNMNELIMKWLLGRPAPRMRPRSSSTSTPTPPRPGRSSPSTTTTTTWRPATSG
jgi:beta-ketodecanoyl-[acyl-carrier-protein] synthase